MDELDNLLLVVEKFTKRKYLKRLNKKLDISSSPNFERLEVKIAMQKLILALTAVSDSLGRVAKYM